MGYRSDVAYTIRMTPDSGDMTQEKLWGAFAIFLEEAMANEDTSFCFKDPDDDHLVIKMDKCEINFYASSVKWYEDYEDVKCHEALLQFARDRINDEENPFGKYLGYIFVRIGENSDDITEDFGGNYDWDWLGISRQIVADFL